ncbi:MAG TPA: hypothetical protein VE996_00175 [Terriglobales bacterium]|nr:hypothetical protein [Terriglobales bacterium]
MVSAIDFKDSWLPHLVEPGSVLVMTNTDDDNSASESFCALLHCPFCLRLVVVTEQQFSGEAVVTCGAKDCPATFYLRDGLPVDLSMQN